MKEFKEESTSLSNLLGDLEWMEGQSFQGNATTNTGPQEGPGEVKGEPQL